MKADADKAAAEDILERQCEEGGAGVAATVTPAPAAPRPEPTCVRTDFAKGDKVVVELRGKKKVTGVVTEVLTAHYHVRIDQGHGDLSGTKKKTLGKSLKHAEPTEPEATAAEAAAEATAESTAEPTGSPAPPAEDMSACSGDGMPAAAADDTWADAAGVFAGFGDD